MLEDSFDATESPIKLSDSSKSYFESAYNASASVRDTANGLTEKAASTTISTVSSTVSSVTKRSPSDEETPKELNEENAIDPNEETHFGKAALKSAAKVFGSIFKAKREVLKSTRESVVKVVHKKFGGDASMVVDRTLGTGYNLSCMMVYFDAKGVSRRVATKGAIQTAKKGKQKELEAQAAIKAEIPEVQAEIPAVQAEIPEVKAVE
jgi:hypothetical protein